MLPFGKKYTEFRVTSSPCAEHFRAGRKLTQAITELQQRLGVRGDGFQLRERLRAHSWVSPAFSVACVARWQWRGYKKRASWCCNARAAPGVERLSFGMFPAAIFTYSSKICPCHVELQDSTCNNFLLQKCCMCWRKISIKLGRLTLKLSYTEKYFFFCQHKYCSCDCKRFFHFCLYVLHLAEFWFSFFF